jgi:thymidine kinase
LPRENTIHTSIGRVIDLAALHINCEKPAGEVNVTVEPGSLVIGNPAIQVSTIEKYKDRCLQEWKSQGLDKYDQL